MDTVDNIRAFITVARAGSFSAAARHIGVAPSVITKRVGRLEDQMRVKLFVRSTRHLQLTDAGERFLPRYADLLRSLEETLRGDESPSQGLAGHLRVKAPRTFSTSNLATILGGFQLHHPNITLDVVLIDRSVDPAEEGFDLALGALSPSYWNVHDEPICPFPRTCCASTEYVQQFGQPTHPRDLFDHDCLTFHAIGTTWSFSTRSGLVNVEVRSKFSANDTNLLHDLCLRGHGIATIASYLAAPSIRAGRLIEILPDYPLNELWLKALVPINRLQRPSVQALLSWLKEHMQPVPIWDRDPPSSA